MAEGGFSAGFLQMDEPAPPVVRPKAEARPAPAAVAPRTRPKKAPPVSVTKPPAARSRPAAPREETPPRTEANPQASNDLVQRLMKASYTAASKCRRIANFLGGNEVRCGASRSKGLCATGVREAMTDAGIHWPRGDAATHINRLKRDRQFRQIAYNPKTAPAGTVLVCKTTRHSYGHVEIVHVESGGRRKFCSDFCTYNPTCSRKSYHSMHAFQLIGGRR